MIKTSLPIREQPLRRTPSQQTSDTDHAPTSRDRTPARRVALVGMGTVGRAVVKILSERREGLLRLTHICNRNVERKKQQWGTELSIPTDVVWTEDFQVILNSDVDIVVELIGGLHPAE